MNAQQRKAKAGIDFLCKTYPGVFSKYKSRPLAIGIDKEIEKRHSVEEIPLLKVSMVVYVNRMEYLFSFRHHEYRIDLDGNEVDKIPDEIKKSFKKRANKLKKMQIEKKKTKAQNILKAKLAQAAKQQKAGKKATKEAKNTVINADKPTSGRPTLKLKSKNVQSSQKSSLHVKCV